jgi:hypothetical protein
MDNFTNEFLSLLAESGYTPAKFVAAEARHHASNAMDCSVDGVFCVTESTDPKAAAWSGWENFDETLIDWGVDLRGRLGVLAGQAYMDEVHRLGYPVFR